MPDTLDFALYFNIAFLSFLGLGLLIGLMRGLKKAMWSFFVTLIFYVIFFLTINQAVNFLWTVDMPFLGGLLANFDSNLQNVTSLQEALPIFLNGMLDGNLTTTLTNENFLELVNAIALFAVKIVYTILYFTVIQIVYRLITWIIRMIVLPSHKKTDKYRSKNRGMGAVFGLLSGALSLYMTLIIFGGLISVSESVLLLFPEPEVESLSFEIREGFASPTDSLIDMPGITNPLDSVEFQQAFDMLTEMVDAYNTNPIVVYQNMVTMPSNYTGEEIPMNLYLFDEVLSINYQESQIAFREEIAVYADAISTVMNSGLFSGETLEIDSVTGDDIRAVFENLSHSNLLTSLIPVAIEAAADYYTNMNDTPVEIPVDDLYAIDWEVELMQLGEIIATTFDIVQMSGLLDDVPVEMAVLDGDDIENLFNQLGESQLITLAAYVAIEPILEMAGETVQAVVTVPEDIVWQDEFEAIGALAGALLNTGLSYGDVSTGDVTAILSVLADIDFTILLDSKILTQAMINILSGAVPSLGIGDYIIIPDDIVWLDELDNEGNIIANGELRNILLAVNALVEAVPDFDLTNLDISVIADFDVDAINAIFESRILVATLTDYVLNNLDFGDQFTIIIPDSVFDEDGYLLKTELQNIVSAAHMLITELVCPVDDLECQTIGFRIAGILELDETNIDTLLLSDVLAATVGNMIMTIAPDMLVIPGEAKTEILVDGIATEVVSREEITRALLAISVLGITDIDNITMDLTILTNLGLEGDPTTLDPDKADTLFSSIVLNATLSKFLIEFSEEVDAILVVPYEDQDENTVRVTDPVDGTEYISQTELTNILKAFLIMDIQDINNIETLDLSLILDNASTLLDSAIIHSTISKMLLDMTEVVTIPINDQLGNPLRITTGPLGFETTFIAKSELEATLDALSVLGITDIQNVTFDMTILNNLGTEADPTILDQDKADQLFSSSIINATLSSYLIEFTDTPEPFVVIPYEDQDGVAVRTIDLADGTEYISQAELTNVLEAILVLNLSDFDTVQTLDLSIILDNINVLLESSIMHATISKQLLDLTEVVVVPLNDQAGDPLQITTGPLGFETTYIARLELQATFDALQVLGITDINNVAIDVSILNNLGTEADPTILDQDKADQLFASSIINATLSDYIIGFASDGEASIIVVPHDDQDSVAIRWVDAADGTEYISQAELTNLLKAILILDLQDFNAVDTLSMDTLIDNINVLLDSAILHATISKQIFDLGAEVVTIPYLDENSNDIRLTVGVLGEETEYIVKTELEAMFDALDLLGITDINNFSGEIDFGSILSVPENVDTLLTSAVIQATISEQVLTLTDDVSGDSLMQVPYYAQDGVTQIRITTGGIGQETEFIIKTEIKAIFDSLNALGITDVAGFTGSIDLSLLADQETVDTVLGSSVIQATISQQIIELDDGSTIIVPYERQDDLTLIRVTVGDPGFETEYIVKAELEAIFDALDVLGITDVESFTGNDQIDLSLLADNNNIDIVLESAMIQAIISRQVLDMDDVSGTIQVPYFQEDDLTVVRISVDDGNGHLTDYISALEIRALVLSLDVLGLTDVTTFSGTVNLALLNDEVNKAIILSSSVIQATISEQLLNSVDGTTFIIPYFEEDNLTPVVIETGPLGLETTYISSTEISDLLDALNVLGITDVNNFDSSNVNFATFAQDDNATIMTESAIFQAIISKQLIDLDISDTIELPFMADDDLTTIRVTVGPLANEVELVVKAEIVNAIMALDMLGVTDPTAFDGNIDLTIFYDSASRDTLLASSIMQATVSQQIFNLGAAITVPLYEDDGITEVRITVGVLGFETEYIVKDEIHAIFESLEILGMDSIQDFNGTISLNAFLPSTSPLDYDANQNILLGSASIQATISKQILDLEDDGFVVIPSTDVLDVSIQNLVFGTDFIFKAEIKSLINAMDLLGITDITSFSGSVGLTSLLASQDANYDANQDIMLASAIMHATITDQIAAMDGGAIVLPSHDVLSAAITVTISLNDFIVKSEIKSLLNAIDLLGFTGDLDSFGGNIDLDAIGISTDQDTLLASAIMHATITDQILGLQGTSLVVPTTDFNDEDIQLSVLGNNFITKNEIKALLNAMDLIGISGDLTAFDGTIALSALFASQDVDYDQNQDTILASAIMHATMTDQISDLSIGGSIVLPTTDVDNISILLTPSLNLFITKVEIKSLLNAMDILGFNGNLDGFDGSIDLTPLLASQDVDYDSNQNIMLLSAIMHATMSDQISNLATIVLPDTDIDAVAIKVLASGNDFLTKAEIKHLIDALDVVGFSGDLNAFGGTIGLANLGDSSSQTILLASAIMHATLSDKLLNDTGGNLIIPDQDINTLTTLRVTQFGFFFIEKNETKALLTALNLMGLTDYSSMNFTPAAIFSADFDTVLESATMQATISSNILSGALDDTAAPGCGSLIVPNYFREDITVATVGEKWIEIVELTALLESLDTLGIIDFSGTVDASTVTGMNDAQLDILLGSGSMQVSIDNMLKDNANINTKIPDLAQEDVYNMTDITTKTEIIAFIKATQQIGAGDITDVTFSTAIIAAMTPEQRDIVLDSMIVRNMLTDELEASMLADDPFDLYWPANTDYMNDDPATFLTEAGINAVLTHYGLI